jgi:hypothetical protein
MLFSQLLRLLNWQKEILSEETWLKTTFYFPIGGRPSEQSKNDNSPHVIGIILGNSLILTCRIIGKKASILTIDGKGLLNAVDNNLTGCSFHPIFGLISSCTTRLVTLGDKIYYVRDRIKNYIHDTPFIVFYVGGESSYSKENGYEYANISFNSGIIGE